MAYIADGTFRCSIIGITGQVDLFSIRLSRGFVLTFYVQDLGKVLAGIQVPEDEYKEFDEFLEKLSYDYVEETENETYKKVSQRIRERSSLRI